jgi:hypothetical protein
VPRDRTNPSRRRALSFVITTVPALSLLSYSSCQPVAGASRRDASVIAIIARASYHRDYHSSGKCIVKNMVTQDICNHSLKVPYEASIMRAKRVELYTINVSCHIVESKRGRGCRNTKVQRYVTVVYVEHTITGPTGPR